MPNTSYSTRMGALLAVAAILLTACQYSPDGPSYSDSPKPVPNNQLATIYLTRSGLEKKMGGRVWFYLNKNAVFNSYDCTFTWVQVPPGLYTVVTKVGVWDFDLGDPSGTYNSATALDVQAEAGKTYYVRFARTNDSPMPGATFIPSVVPPFIIYAPQTTQETRSQELLLEEPEVGSFYPETCVYMKNSYTSN